MDMKKQPRNFQKLIDKLRENSLTLIPFIGSGLSVYGFEEVRLPSWWQLLSKVIEFGFENMFLDADQCTKAHKKIEDGKLIAAADYIATKMGYSQFTLAIETLLSTKNKPIPPAITAIAKAKWPLIVTTNLDTFIERAWATAHDEPLNVLTEGDAATFLRSLKGNSDSSVLWKIHGSLERRNTWVLTKKQYKNTISKDTYKKAFQALLKRDLIFLGFGLNDGDFNEFIDELEEVFETSIGDYYALLPDTASVNKDLLERLKKSSILPIWYHHDVSKTKHEDCGHGDLTRLLNLICDALINDVAKIEIDLNSFPKRDPFFSGYDTEKYMLSNYIMNSKEKSVCVVGAGGVGKTLLVLEWLTENAKKLVNAGFYKVAGGTLARSYPGEIIENLYVSIINSNDYLSISEKRRLLTQELRNNRYLIVIDNLETVQKQDGSLIDFQLEDLITDLIYNSASKLIITSRFNFQPSATIELNGLMVNDCKAILKHVWEYSPSEVEVSDAFKRTKGHPLSLRLHASLYLREKTSKLKIDTPPPQWRQEQIVKFYLEKLNSDEKVALICVGLFRFPVESYIYIELLKSNQIFKVFGIKLTSWQARKTVKYLIGLRVLEEDDNLLLSAHPIIRDYTIRQCKAIDTYILHQFLLDFLLTDLEHIELPTTLSDALPILNACYHAAAIGNWETYFLLYHDLLCAPPGRWLGGKLGSWTEVAEVLSWSMDTASLAKSKPKIKPAFLLGDLAYALRKLGNNETAYVLYKRAIELSIGSEPDNTARYVNNFNSLLCSCGLIENSLELLRENLNVTAWISDSQKQIWQYQHALFDGAKTYFFLGNNKKALAFYRRAMQLYEENSYLDKIYALQVMYYPEVLWANNVQLNKVIDVINFLRKKSEGWPDIQAMANRVKATVIRKALVANKIAQHEELVLQVEEALTKARQIGQPHLEIEAILEFIYCSCLLLKKKLASMASYGFIQNSLRELQKKIERHKLYLYMNDYLLAVKIANSAFETTMDVLDTDLSDSGSMREVFGYGCIYNYLQLTGISKPVEQIYHDVELTSCDSFTTLAAKIRNKLKDMPVTLDIDKQHQLFTEEKKRIE